MASLMSIIAERAAGIFINNFAGKVIGASVHNVPEGVVGGAHIGVCAAGCKAEDGGEGVVSGLHLTSFQEREGKPDPCGSG